jgi:hypothetical protein
MNLLTGSKTQYKYSRGIKKFYEDGGKFVALHSTNPESVWTLEKRDSCLYRESNCDFSVVQV